MKRLVVVFLAVLTIFSSCQKEEILSSSEEMGKYEQIRDEPELQMKSSCTLLYSAVSYNGKMLVFQDENHFDEVVECLTNAVEEYNFQLERQYGYMNDDEINDLIDQIGFDEDRPLADFEATFSGFKSLRADIEKRINLWLSSSVLDHQNDPDDHPVLDEVERSLLNIGCKVQIGNTVFDACAGSYDKALFGCNSEGCCWRGREREPFDRNDKQFVAYVNLNGWPWKSKVKSKIVAFRRKNGKWRKFRTTMTSSFAGTLGTGSSCSPNSTVFESKRKRRKKVKVKRNFWGAFPYARVQNDDIIAAFEFDGVFANLPLRPND